MARRPSRAVIVEPVAGSAGVLPPPVGYLERLRALCTKHGILLIFDEVITGFGRLGAPFAAQFFGVTPGPDDHRQGVTNGAFPMGAVFAGRHVHDALMQGPETAIELFHGYTYSGHPGGLRGGPGDAGDLSPRGAADPRRRALARLGGGPCTACANCPNVIDIRNIGLMAGGGAGAAAGRAPEPADLKPTSAH